MHGRLRKAAFPLIAAIILLTGVVAAQPGDVPGPSGGEEQTEGNQTDGGGGPPGFVSGLVDAVTPAFLGDLFSSLPVPGFVKNFFGGG